MLLIVRYVGKDEFTYFLGNITLVVFCEMIFTHTHDQIFYPWISVFQLKLAKLTLTGLFILDFAILSGEIYLVILSPNITNSMRCCVSVVSWITFPLLSLVCHALQFSGVASMIIQNSLTDCPRFLPNFYYSSSYLCFSLSSSSKPLILLLIPLLLSFIFVSLLRNVFRDFRDFCVYIFVEITFCNSDCSSSLMFV